MIEKLRMNCIRDCGAGGFGDATRRGRIIAVSPLSRPKQSIELRNVEPVRADAVAIEQQDRHVQAVATRELAVRIHVHDVEGWQRACPRRSDELPVEFLAQPAFLARQ
jgi:hypothetical protein